MAIISPWYPSAERPGLGVFVREHARALSEATDVVVIHPDVDVAAARGAWTIGDAIEDGLRTLRLHVRRPHDRGLRVVLQVGALRAALGRLRHEGWMPDVLHAHVFSTGLTALASRSARTPVVVTEHYSGLALGQVTGFDLKLARWTFEHADFVSPVSENLAAHLLALGVRAPLRVMPNAVDVERFRPRVGRRPAGPVRALLVAGLTEVKRVDVLLEALARRRGPEIVLDVVGDGPLLSDLEERAARLGLASRVSFLGRRTGAEVAECMRAADLFVLSSRWENLPVVLLEAMATGLPIVATRVGGVPEIVGEDAGVLVPPGDSDALADALADVAARIDRFDAEELHRRAAERYGCAAVTDRWLEIYNGLLSGRETSRA